MGRNNKQRRAAKKRQRQRAGARARRSAARGGHPHGDEAGGRERHRHDHHDHRAPPPLEELLLRAAWASRHDEPASAGLVDELEIRARRGEPVGKVADRLLRESLEALWEHGWAPTDVVHVVGRALSAAHATVVTAAVVADGRTRQGEGEVLHARWRSQLDVLETRLGSAATPRGRFADADVRATVTVLGLLAHLPAIPSIMPAPGSADAALADVTRLDQRMLARVRALLAKAESTEFDEEAEALTAKAQELITRHAIADALLHTPDDVGRPATRRMHLDDPYVDAKASLLNEIATANRCTAVHVIGFAWVTVFGYDRDLDAVELLGASLLAQATSAMVRHGSRRDVTGRSTTRSFRRSFLMGFAIRIGERLRDATRGEVSATSETDREHLLPVLAARDDRVRAAREAAFPRTTESRTSISNPTGWAAGRAAADQATIDMSAGRLRR